MTFWTDARTQQLREMTAAGRSTLEIMKALGAVSRNVVIGKANRLKLLNTRPRIKAERGPIRDQKRRNYVKIQNPEPLPNVKVEVDNSAAVHLVDALRHHCRYVLGDPQDMMFCGKQTVKKTFWCKEHFQLFNRTYTRSK